MSAALAHGDQLPLTAQRMQLAAAAVAARPRPRRRRLQSAQNRWTRCSRAWRRLPTPPATFARKSPGGLRERPDPGHRGGPVNTTARHPIADEQVSTVLHLTRPAWVRGDATRPEQVLINLRAPRWMRCRTNPASARKSVSADEQLWRLSVIDNGGGIAEENPPKCSTRSSPPNRSAMDWASGLAASR